MSTDFTDNIENEYLKKIIDKQTNVFFQFKLSPDNSIDFDYLNGAVMDIFEVSVDDIKENPKYLLVNAVHPDDSIKFKNSIFKAYNAIDSFELDFRIVLPSKKTKWVRASAETERGDNGDVIFYGTMSDITSIKEKEEDYKIFE
jgi:PAS domain-containing protein